jgi:hypothetical protein
MAGPPPTGGTASIPSPAPTTPPPATGRPAPMAGPAPTSGPAPTAGPTPIPSPAPTGGPALTGATVAPLGEATVEFAAAADPTANPDAEAPAGQTATSYRDRARLRRRLRYLRRARELGFRDLGGFVFDAHRFGRPRQDIVAAKLKGLAGMDAELRALETALDDRRELMLLHEPGISVCPRCATLHGSDANFCSGCGLPRGGAALPLGPRAPLPPPEATRPLGLSSADPRSPSAAEK